jgi:UDP-N-acetylmuramoyl-L-alanyl-D-glutamate--2,6-diaminopimelate ligase
MTLSSVLEGIPIIKMFQTMYGQMVVTHEIDVHRIQYDSRKVERGDLFVAIRGTDNDGHTFIDDAINRGAKVVVVEDDAKRPDSFFMHAGVVKVVVNNTRSALARMSSNYYGNPSQKLRLVGVTGTNGKTTTVYLIAELLEKSGLVGTIEYRIGNTSIPASHTTPESLELNMLLARMVEERCSSAVMEVSSHALHQRRVEGLTFELGVFTNLTQDHLDYHGTMDEYFHSKKILFDSLSDHALAVTNADDGYGMKIVKSTRAKVFRYGITSPADIQAKDIVVSVQGTSFSVFHNRNKTSITSSLIGRFNVYNILAAFATAIGLGLSEEKVQRAIAKFQPVRGRFERIVSPGGYTVIIDYAHTPDALHNCLAAIHDIFNSGERKNKGRIITVFGCGGNRDRGKRPKMGKIATQMSDVTIITSDNPRFEDPEVIIDEIMSGVLPEAKVYREADRRKAIEQALSLAQAGDVVLIAGKGHETYQVIENRKIHFSDHEVVQDFFGN